MVRYLRRDTRYGIFIRMIFLAKLLLRIVLNGIVVRLAVRYFPGFLLTGGINNLAICAIVLALLNTFVKPIIRLITAPLRWITLGLFNIIINIGILWFADQILPFLAIQNTATLFFTSLIISFTNAFF